MPAKHQPDYVFLRHVPLRRIHLFTLVQIVCLAVLWILKSTVAAIIFPVMVIPSLLQRGFLGFNGIFGMVPPWPPSSSPLWKVHPCSKGVFLDLMEFLVWSHRGRHHGTPILIGKRFFWDLRMIWCGPTMAAIIYPTKVIPSSFQRVFLGFKGSLAWSHHGHHHLSHHGNSILTGKDFFWGLRDFWLGGHQVVG